MCLSHAIIDSSEDNLVLQIHRYHKRSGHLLTPHQRACTCPEAWKAESCSLIAAYLLELEWSRSRCLCMHRNVLWVLQAEPHQVLDLPQQVLIKKPTKSGPEACLLVRRRNASAVTDKPRAVEDAQRSCTCHRWQWMDIMTYVALRHSQAMMTKAAEQQQNFRDGSTCACCSFTCKVDAGTNHPVRHSFRKSLQQPMPCHGLRQTIPMGAQAGD